MTKLFSARFATVAFSLALVLGAGSQLAHAAALTTTLDFGATGPNVTSLQTYLASDANVYPSGLITGYFGPLTQAGVEMFQAQQGIVSSGTPATTGYGRVGPLTLARINSLMGDGMSVESVPVVNTPSVQDGNTSATVMWSTNELTQGELYWSASPIVAYEATGSNQQPNITGTLASDGNGLQSSHSITLSGLQPNTTYYYMVYAINGNGGVTVTWPEGSFETTN
jgi:peptidoglycan hydrolase-like protein with peptidoglycan-binding domain